ncbi:MAG: hypothetical protein RML56_13560 [Burkholderiales bacterium]|nr:hypothetical protein [Burkholderiales bacterium]
MAHVTARLALGVLFGASSKPWRRLAYEHLRARTPVAWRASWVASMSIGESGGGEGCRRFASSRGGGISVLAPPQMPVDLDGCWRRGGVRDEHRPARARTSQPLDVARVVARIGVRGKSSLSVM